MSKETKRRVGIMIMGIIGVISLLVGVSYAAFSTNLAGTQIQGVQSGCLKVDMADSGNLSLTNQVPETDQNGLLSTPYTYILTNTCTTDAYYTATINVLDTSNQDNIAKTKIALGGDSYLAPTLESNLEEIESVDTSQTNIEKTYKLDEGYIKVGDTKTFELRTWIDYDVTEITGTIENMVIVTSKASGNGIINHDTNTAGYQVLSKSELITNASYKSIAPNGDQISGIVKIGEGENAKYYFRGNPNNYITFAGKTFRILSTNNDGSINIVLDSIYKTDTYANLSTNLTSFYNEISSEEKYIKTDQTFCEEKADANSNYIASIRVENQNPTTSCASNNFLTKVGLLTADDLMYAGAKTGTANTNFYPAETNSYYTSSHKNSTTVYGYSQADSITAITKTTSSGIKPVITLKSDTLLYGQGTEELPFYVSGTYSEVIEKYTDETAPTIVYARVDEKWSKENKQISISAKDNPGGSGIAGYLISTSNTAPSLTDTSWEASSSQKYMSVNAYDNGTYYVFVKDNNGNISESTKLVIEKVDKQAPTCTLRINPNGTVTNYKTLTILSEDTNIDIKGYSWAHTDSTEDAIKISENGVYTAYLTDLAGNQGSCSATITTIKPSIATKMLMSKVGTSGLEVVTHEADSTLQIGATEDITEYRYRGGNDVVTNNYVYFNCEDIENQTADTCELYRIIGMFPTDDGTGKIENRIKLIKEESYGEYEWDNDAYKISSDNEKVEARKLISEDANYEVEKMAASIIGSGQNNWSEAYVKDVLNITYWNTIDSKYQTLVEDVKYYLGGFTSAGITVDTMYGYERKISGSDYYYGDNPNNWVGKIGLMYLSDYGYGAPNSCTSVMSAYNTSGCYNNNWLYKEMLEALISHQTSGEIGVFAISTNGSIASSNVYSDTAIGTAHDVRPVFYLNLDAVFVDGDGSIDDPYQLIK